MQVKLLTEFSAVLAVDVVHVVAFVAGSLELVKNQTIFAQMFGCYSILLNEFNH